jgi:hypothetical protein
MGQKVTEAEIAVFLEARKRPNNTWKDIARAMVLKQEGIDEAIINKYQQALEGDKASIKAVQNRIRTLRKKTK